MASIEQNFQAAFLRKTSYNYYMESVKIRGTETKLRGGAGSGYKAKMAR